MRHKVRRKLTSMMTRAYGAYRVGSKGKSNMWSKLTKNARVKSLKRKWKNPKAGLRRKRYYIK